MITITFDEAKKKIDVPQSWNDIRLGDYEKWFATEPSTRLEQIHYIAGICNIDAELLLDSPTQVFDVVYDNIRFIFDENAGGPDNRVGIDGCEYVISFSDELTLAEWVDIESVFESDSSARLSEILSILCRPAGEIYDNKVSSARRDMFAKLTMDKALPLLAFFLLRNEQSERITSLYSRIKDQVSLYLDLMRNFAASGDGIKSLPIWQRIKFWFLMKFLQKRLSKFLGFSSINSTKIKPKKNRIIF